jgi:hypothetical protein
MAKTLKINEQVKVLATFDDEDICHPIQMEFRGHEIKFNKFRINYADQTQNDKKIFDLFDQKRRYRLIFNIDNLSWLLDSVGLKTS